MPCTAPSWRRERPAGLLFSSHLHNLSLSGSSAWLGAIYRQASLRGYSFDRCHSEVYISSTHLVLTSGCLHTCISHLWASPHHTQALPQLTSSKIPFVPTVVLMKRVSILFPSFSSFCFLFLLVFCLFVCFTLSFCITLTVVGLTLQTRLASDSQSSTCRSLECWD